MVKSFQGARQLSPSSLGLLISIVVLLAIVGMAQASDLCTDINYLIDQSRSDFVKIRGEPSSDSPHDAVTLTLTGATDCRVTKKSSKNFYQCHWEFPHRAEEAYDTFDELVRSVHECLGKQATVHNDQKVNHPDFYALTRYETEKASVNISVKDKSALERTFVFIRIQGGQSY